LKKTGVQKMVLYRNIQIKIFCSKPQYVTLNTEELPDLINV